MVVGEGFEPSKAEPADLQSAPFDRSGTQPNIFLWCRLSESNQSPTDYKSVALPDELKRHTTQLVYRNLQTMSNFIFLKNFCNKSFLH